MTELFFIYGTLKRGHRNHDLLLQSEAQLIADRALASDLAFVEAYNGTPGAVQSGGCSIYGEVWELSGVNLTLLEKLEKGYKKVKIHTFSKIGNGHLCSCYVWEHPYIYILGYVTWERELELLSMEKGLQP